MFRRSEAVPKVAEQAGATETHSHGDAALLERIVGAIKMVYDPEIPVNIYDLGLIYGLHVDTSGHVSIRMTLTAPACPVAGTMPGIVEGAVRQVDGVLDASVELVWDPPWSVDRMSDEARLALDMYD